MKPLKKERTGHQKNIKYGLRVFFLLSFELVNFNLVTKMGQIIKVQRPV